MNILPSADRALDEAEAEAAFGAMLDGSLADDVIAEFLIALSVRGETASEIAGAARALRARMIPIQAPANAIDRRRRLSYAQRINCGGSRRGLVRRACGQAW
jgi:anthranilate phosphoribosyltransferase